MKMNKCKTISFLLLILAIFSYPLIQWYKAGCVYRLDKSIIIDDKIALVTGANAGVGFETVKELAHLGCHVIMGCRSEARCLKAKNDITASLSNDTHPMRGKLSILPLDLVSLNSVRSAAKRVMSSYAQLDYLVLNAGILTFEGINKTTEQGHELHFGVNHLGHFLLTKLLLPFMKSTRKSTIGEPVRVVSVSSTSHYFFSDRINLLQPGYGYSESAYSPYTAYAQSKLANVLHMRELAQREIAATPSGRPEDAEVIAVSAHPGGVATEICRDICEIPIYAILRYFAGFIAKTSKEGAQTQLSCVLADSEFMLAFNGEYFEECAPRASTVHAHSIADARALWDLSETLVADFV